jgi:hypothetical protein
MPPARPMHYWVNVICRESFQSQRFATEREAMAYAWVHARLPDAELVAVEACEAGKRTTIFVWPEGCGRRPRLGSHRVLRRPLGI